MGITTKDKFDSFKRMERGSTGKGRSHMKVNSTKIIHMEMVVNLEKTTGLKVSTKMEKK